MGKVGVGGLILVVLLLLWAALCTSRCSMLLENLERLDAVGVGGEVLAAC
jgi:hypothetical protein